MNNNYKYFIALLLLFFSVNASAGTMADIGQMFANGTNTWVAAIRLIRIIAYVIGAYLIVASIMNLPKTSDPQSGITIKNPIIMFSVGVILFTVMGTLDVVTTTMAMGSGAGDALLDKVNGGTGPMAAAVTGVLTFIRMIGYIAFIRGWLMLNQYSGRQAQPGMMSRGLTHIIGGVAAINVKTTALMLVATFAPGLPIATYLG